MNEITNIIEESVSNLFQSHANSDAVEVMESGGFPSRFWEEFYDGGWCGITLPEDEGGAGMGLAGGYILMRLSGYHAVPLPIVEPIISTHLLSLAGLPPQNGFSTVAIADSSVENEGSYHFKRVPWARHASGLVVVIPGESDARLVWIDRAQLKVAERTNVAGEPRDDVMVNNEALKGAVILPGISPARVLSWFALGRAAQMTGALVKALDRTVEYANERKQFGRLIGKLQALQQQIAVQAEYVNYARCAVDTAIIHLDSPQEWECIAAAKISAGEAAGKVCNTAHAVHGAIGFTREHLLQMSTRRLWAWRDEYGNEAQWATKLGDLCLGIESGSLWPWLTEQSHK